VLAAVAMVISFWLSVAAGDAEAAAARLRPAPAQFAQVMRAHLSATKPKKSTPKAFKITGTGVLGGSVPDWAVAAFATFEQPRAASLPYDIARMFVGSKKYRIPRFREWGIDYHEARQLDVASRRFYFIPGEKAICLFFAQAIGGSILCVPNGPLAYHNGLSFDLVPPPTDEQLDEWIHDRSKPYPTGGPVVTIGVAPRGVTQVMLHSLSHEDRVASQVGEGYVGATKDIIIARTFSGPTVSPYDSAPYTPLR
jgi:hypothetical protein